MAEADFLPSMEVTERFFKVRGMIKSNESLEGKFVIIEGMSNGVDTKKKISPRDYLSNMVIGTIVNISHVYREKNERQFTIAEDGDFSEHFLSLFTSFLEDMPINAQEFYSGLYRDLSQFARNNVQYSWGDITSNEKGIYVTNIPQQEWVTHDRKRARSIGGLGFD